MTGGNERSSEETFFRDEAPAADALTSYDEAHMATYLQLLYGSAEGHDISRLAFDAFGIDAASEPGRAEQIVDSHLRRARWMCGKGSRHFSST